MVPFFTICTLIASLDSPLILSNHLLEILSNDLAGCSITVRASYSFGVRGLYLSAVSGYR